MENISLSEYQKRQKPQLHRKRPFNNLQPKYGLAIVVGVILLALSFVGGMQYQKGKTTTSTTASTTSTASPQNNQQSSGMGGPGGGSMQGNRAVGTVTSISDTSITIETQGGSSKTYTISSSTTVNDNGETASISDIQSGNTVFLSIDSSDTSAVSSIELNPSFGGGGDSQSGNSSSSNSTTTPSTSSI